MSTPRKHRQPKLPKFVWRPGEGIDETCLERMRTQFRRPAKPMGEAWFMGGKRRMFDSLLGDLDGLTAAQLREPLYEIASGNSSFGPMEEWTAWYRYLLAQLVPRSEEHSFDSLYQRLVTAFIAVHPRGIEETYPGFADDARHTLGRCLMNPSRWSGGRLAVCAPEDPFDGGRHQAFEWTVSCGDFSAGMFLCAMYVDDAEFDDWLDSVFAIDCPLWSTQLFVWLLEIHPLLSGKVSQIGNLKLDSSAAWNDSHLLRGDFSGIHTPDRVPLPLLSPDRRESILDAARRHVSEQRYFDWLDSIKQYEYLDLDLGDKPSQFADVFGIG